MTGLDWIGLLCLLLSSSLLFCNIHIDLSNLEGERYNAAQCSVSKRPETELRGLVALLSEIVLLHVEREAEEGPKEKAFACVCVCVENALDPEKTGQWRRRRRRV